MNGWSEWVELIHRSQKRCEDLAASCSMNFMHCIERTLMGRMFDVCFEISNEILGGPFLLRKIFDVH